MNKVMVAGIVAEEPVFLSNTFYGNALQVKLDVNRRDIHKVERLTCYIISDNLIDRGLEEIQTGDYLVSQSARIVTLEHVREKFFVCPHCGKESRRVRRATQSDIVLYDFNLSHGISLEDSVGINKAFAIGMVRNNIRKRDEHMASNIPTKFQLVINRAKGLEQRLRDSAPEGFAVESFDLPQVACFGHVGEQAEEYVHKGDFLLVDGCVQEREFKQKIPFQCKYCGEYSDQYFRYPVHEIIASRLNPQRVTTEEVKAMASAGSIVNDMGETSLPATENDEAPEETVKHVQETIESQHAKAEARKEARHEAKMQEKTE